MPDYTSDFPDMVEPAFILFDGKGGGEFACGCVTGAIYGAGDGNAIEFSWEGNDEMDEACGEGWAELQPNGSLIGQVCFQGGDEANFTARPWKTSSNPRFRAMRSRRSPCWPVAASVHLPAAPFPLSGPVRRTNRLRPGVLATSPTTQ